MTNIFQKFITLFPIFILIITLFCVLLSISCKRNHFLVNLMTIIGLNAALIACFIIEKYVNLNVTELLLVDSYSIFYTTLIILGSTIICIFAYNWLSNFPENKEEFYLLIIISTIGGVILTEAIHLSSFFIGLELVSLPLCGLIGYSVRLQKNSLEASLKYTILSAVTSSLILFGIALIYAKIGTLSLIQIGHFLQNSINTDPIILVGFGMLIVGLGFKLSLFPFHLWTADVYQGSPLPSSAFLATVSKIAIFSVMMRFFIEIPISENQSIHLLIYIMSSLSILVGNLMAISQNNIKRILGYSSIANVGYLIITCLTVQYNHKLGLETASIYLITYLLSNLGVFGIMNLISSPYKDSDADSIYHYRGLFWHSPIISALMTIMLLSLAGIPITLGFIGKFYIISANLDAKFWFLLINVAIGSAIGVYFYLRIVISLYLHPPKFYFHDVSNYWAYTPNGIIIIMIAILILFLGIYPQPLIELVSMTHL